MRLRWFAFVLAAVLAFGLLAMGQASGSGGPRVSSAPLNPAHMRALPAQGIVVQRAHDLLLLGLDGRPYGRLVGFKLAFDADLTARNLAFQQLAETVADRILIVHFHAHWYELDGKGLHGLGPTQVALPGGTTLVAHGKAFSDGGFAATMTVTRNGHRLTAIGPTDLVGSGGGLLYTSAGTVLDPASGKFWRTQHGCVPAGLRQGTLLGLCPRTKEGPVDLDVLTPDGGHHLAARLPSHAPFPTQAELSPNGRYVAAALSFGCGPSYAFVVPTAGGQGRSVLGERTVPFTPSSVLGWAANGRLIAYAARKGSCEGESEAGLYSIDPRTFARRMISSQDGSIWNPIPR